MTHFTTSHQGNPDIALMINRQSIWYTFSFVKGEKPTAVTDYSMCGIKIEHIHGQRM
ncbi:hypothetical protein XBFFL1_980002 [Xenorhabdus bovienii str. feltiae Florida]|nr:hypothetical protein XBFFR1_1830027 [Xenorhabdus bovienii str. feltiae France]CDG94982.1 hypothetical protein XBFFL1_980002 [Xenorhabdus bovienii str. feltiae Florida]